MGVPVVTYGRTDDFPAFYNPKSGFKVSMCPVIYHQIKPFFLRIRALGELIIPWMLQGL